MYAIRQTFLSLKERTHSMIMSGVLDSRCRAAHHLCHCRSNMFIQALAIGVLPAGVNGISEGFCNAQLHCLIMRCNTDVNIKWIQQGWLIASWTRSGLRHACNLLSCCPAVWAVDKAHAQ